MKKIVLLFFVLGSFTIVAQDQIGFTCGYQYNTFYEKKMQTMDLANKNNDQVVFGLNLSSGLGKNSVLKNSLGYSKFNLETHYYHHDYDENMYWSANYSSTFQMNYLDLAIMPELVFGEKYIMGLSLGLVGKILLFGVEHRVGTYKEDNYDNNGCVIENIDKKLPIEGNKFILTLAVGASYKHRISDLWHIGIDFRYSNTSITIYLFNSDNIFNATNLSILFRVYFTLKNFQLFKDTGNT